MKHEQGVGVLTTFPSTAPSRTRPQWRRLAFFSLARCARLIALIDIFASFQRLEAQKPAQFPERAELASGVTRAFGN